MDVRMDGRVAVITGGSTGLGLAMAKEFAASGGSVAMLARKADVLATAKAEEFARMACFLCSDAGSFITGVAINVDGGASPVV